MTRTEHLAWCKERALEYLDGGDLVQALASFQSDMAKNDETAATLEAPAIQSLAVLAMMHAQTGNSLGVYNYIVGFN